MSKSNSEDQLFNIESFEAQSIPKREQRPTAAGRNNQIKAAYTHDPSVCAWNFPVVEKDADDPAKREDLKAKLARLEKEAYEKGFEQGQKDGLSLEKSKLEALGKQLDELFKELRDLKPKIYSESEGETLKLVIAIAKKIIKEEIKANKDIIGNTIRSAFSFLSDKREIRITISPDDMEEVRRILPDLSKLTKGGHFQLIEDRSVERGGCVLETGFGRVNCMIDDQLAIIEEEIEKQYHAATGTYDATIS